MKKAKRILALTGVILLVAMYVATLVFALIDSPQSFALLKASIYCTIVIPVIIYSGTLIFNNAARKKGWPVDKNEKDSVSEDETDNDSGSDPKSSK